MKPAIQPGIDYIHFQCADVALEARVLMRMRAEYGQHQITVFREVLRIEQPQVMLRLAVFHGAFEGIADFAPAQQDHSAIGQLDMAERHLPKRGITPPMGRPFRL
ncbi:hypothetical protein AO738_28980 [Pseudomonas citronellolis]|nr:hypothetical protein AO742_17860 [Pseudomonas citronellolis]KRW77774.1 hypothetical protein AO738_28980 [Pseudomonas citronellolis]